MGCEACQLHVKGLLEASSGVIGSAVDFEAGTAVRLHFSSSYDAFGLIGTTFRL